MRPRPLQLLHEHSENRFNRAAQFVLFPKPLVRFNPSEVGRSDQWRTFTTSCLTRTDNQALSVTTNDDLRTFLVRAVSRHPPKLPHPLFTSRSSRAIRINRRFLFLSLCVWLYLDIYGINHEKILPYYNGPLPINKVFFFFHIHFFGHIHHQRSMLIVTSDRG